MTDRGLTPTIAERLLSSKHLESAAQAIISRDRKTCTASLAALLADVCTGVPLLGVLARDVVRCAFVEPATERLLREFAAYEAEKDREAFIRDLARAVEVFVAQALHQLVCAQDRGEERLLEALGELRRDFNDFREAFATSLARTPRAHLTEALRIDEQEVSDGAPGIRVSPPSQRPGQEGGGVGLQMGDGCQVTIGQLIVNAPSRDENNPADRTSEDSREPPSYRSQWARHRSLRLRELRRRLKELAAIGADTTALDGEIRLIRRELRNRPPEPGWEFKNGRYILWDELGHGGSALFGRHSTRLARSTSRSR